MCILLTTTNHPDYPFILLSNRDEFFNRPTKRAHFRDFGGGIKLLTPLDLARPEHGTWIGVNTDGKLSVVLNYRESNMGSAISEISRGILPLHFLQCSVDDDGWYEELTKSLDETQLQKIGGFTLFYGSLKLDPKTKKVLPLNILSNRSTRSKVLISDDFNEPKSNYEVTRKTTFGLSNSVFFDPWPKVIQGESLLDKTLKKSLEYKLSQEDLVKECFQILSNDNYNKEIAKNGSFNSKIHELRNSIFIPPVDLGSNPSLKGKYYGTRTQTVILLDTHGNLNYYERDLHNSDDFHNSKILEQKFSFKVNIT